MHKRKGITGFEADHLIEQDMCMFQSMVYHLATRNSERKYDILWINRILSKCKQ
ncbi:hypothetical protein [Lysinibacillus fusiformis]|uniref:hypothetical protein n=1 Tax=Lysinibacillus fusiformis TaxID=28031 RepID=UPI002E1B0DF0|nr:hypothetical protein [Lysinibacillus fusiformis]